MAHVETDAGFEALLEYVRDQRGFDYTGYKRPSLIRRFQRRMAETGTTTWEGYLDLLERDPEEFSALFDSVLINVTRFFRDPPAWELLAEEVVPRLLAAREDGGPIRVWSTGCASGEEAYSLAILLCEALGRDDFQRRVTVYGTDIDEDALTEARRARYSARDLEDVPEDLRERYFQPTGAYFAVRADVRRAAIFGRNDLLCDPPISRLDLLASRNTLMYFGRESQERVLANFHFAMRPDGYLFLGKAEALATSTPLFTPYELSRRVFVKNATGRPIRLARPVRQHLRRAMQEQRPEARQTGFEQSPLAQLIVDDAGNVAAANQQTREMFGLTPSDIGRPLHDLELSYRPLDLRSRLDEAYESQRHVVVRGVPWNAPDGAQRTLEVSFAPLFGKGGTMQAVGISFTDVTRFHLLQEEVERHQRDLVTAYEELQSTVEELETTNEELQSTNEELETTNEELQSTNEELETMNEELHSTNEELETMNEELRDQTDHATRAHAFLGSILASVRQSVVVVDEDEDVTVWNDAAAELWGLRADEVTGRRFFDLDVGLPVTDLRTPVRAVLAGERPAPVELRARDRRGRLVLCTVSFSSLQGFGEQPAGVVLVTECVPLDE